MPSVAIIGAGCSGLIAAQELQNAGYTVTIFEKSRGVGGRTATRKREGFIYDHGAQYIKSDSPVVTALVTERFQAADLVNIAKPVWIFDGQGHIQEGDPQENAKPKWTYRNGLTTFAKKMAEGLDIQFETRVGFIQQIPGGWSLIDISSQHVGDFDSLLITIPATQAINLIEASQIKPELRNEIGNILGKAHYNPLISVMLGYKHAPRMRPYYALVNTDKASAISWLAWEHEKAPERTPGGAGLLIVQMAPHYSLQHWEYPNEEIFSDVAVRVTTLLDERLTHPVFTDIQRWRYALPVEKADSRALHALTLPFGLAFCGDGFVGGRVHLALEHGIEIARQMIESHR